MLIRDGRPRRRWGGTLGEVAVTSSLALTLVMGMMIVGLGVFRYQQVAALAREGSRWAAVHGPLYVQNQGGTQPTWATIKSSAILPKVAGMDTTKISGSVQWLTPSGGTQAGAVSVTVQYAWTPEAFLTGPITLTSTSTVPITY